MRRGPGGQGIPSMQASQGCLPGPPAPSDAWHLRSTCSGRSGPMRWRRCSRPWAACRATRSGPSPASWRTQRASSPSRRAPAAACLRCLGPCADARAPPLPLAVALAPAVPLVCQHCLKACARPSAACAAQRSPYQGPNPTAPQDLMNRLGCGNLYSDGGFPDHDADVRSNYIMNSSIQGADQADVVLLIGSNPRLEAPVFNARCAPWPWNCQGCVPVAVRNTTSGPPLTCPGPGSSPVTMRKSLARDGRNKLAGNTWCGPAPALPATPRTQLP